MFQTCLNLLSAMLKDNIEIGEHISLHFNSLHWLPIDTHIKYKLACICYNCMSTIRIHHPTSLTFLPFTPLPVSFAHFLTTLSSVVHLSVQYPVVKGLSHTPPLSICNSLLQQVHSSDSVPTFRSQTKTQYMSIFLLW